MTERRRDIARALFGSFLLILSFVLFGGFSYMLADMLMDGHADVVVVTCFADFAFTLILLFMRHDRIHKSVILTSRLVPRTVVLPVLAAVCWFVGICASTWVASSFADTAFVARNITSTGSPAWAINMLSLVFAPVVEEVLVRGACWCDLREHLGPKSSAVISSAMFAGMHGSLTHLPHTFLLGCLLCLMRERGCPLWCCMVVHSLFNLASLVVAPVLDVPHMFVTMPFVGIVYALTLGLVLFLVHLGGRPKEEVDE